MFKTIITIALFLVLGLSGCADNMAAPSGYNIPVTLCDPNAESCQAALALTETVCERRVRCDAEFTPTFEQCVEWSIPNVCKTFDGEAYCTGPYADRETLDACLAAYSEASCDESVTTCGLTR